MDGDYYTCCGYPRKGDGVGGIGIAASEDCLICQAGLKHTVNKKIDEALYKKLEKEIARNG